MLSIGQISKLIGSSKDTVRRGLVRHKIAVREKSQHHGHPAQPKFGQRVQRGRVVEFKVEQRVATAVREMHTQGLALRQIAKVLDQMGISTKCRGKKWHPQMVKRIIENESIAIETTLPKESSLG